MRNPKVDPMPEDLLAVRGNPMRLVYFRGPSAELGGRDTVRYYENGGMRFQCLLSTFLKWSANATVVRQAQEPTK